MWCVGEGTLGPEIKGSCSRLRPRDPAAAGVPCSMVVRVQVCGDDVRVWEKGLPNRVAEPGTNPQKAWTGVKPRQGSGCSDSTLDEGTKALLRAAQLDPNSQFLPL